MWSEKQLLMHSGMRNAICCRKRRWWNIAVLVLTAVSGTLADFNVTLRVPIAVAENSTVKMTCDYNLHENQLYAVKWYKSKHEFYRYIPKEMPPRLVFQPLAAKVDFNQSDARSVVLKNVDQSLAGKYVCEVSVDKSFITKTELAYMHVVKLPVGNLTVRAEKPRYALGDTIRTNCTAPPGDPPANITWTVNGLPINSSYTRNIQTKYANDSRMISIAGLEFDAIPENFIHARLHIACRANVFNLYKEELTIILEEERPRLSPVLGTRESSQSRSSVSSVEKFFLVVTIANTLLGSMR